MAAKVKSPSPARAAPIASTAPPPLTFEERVKQIEAMGLRIDGYVRYMAQVATLAGTSTEAKERAVAAFHDRLAVAEGQLARIQEELRLG